MIQVKGLTKYYGKQVLFEEIAFSLSAGEKVGFVGRNGSGKSTLFRLILGEEEAEAGVIAVPKGYRIGTLPQHIRFTCKTVLEEAALVLGPGEEHETYRVERILFGLGFSKGDMEKDPALFSGGFQTRINLAKALVQNPNLLLLDEPTNYMDIVSKRWLQQYLRSYSGEILLITHDRDFMNATMTHTMGFCRKQLKKIEGSTHKYFERIAEEELNYNRTKENQEREKKHLEKYINRFRASARRASQAQSRVKQLARFDEMIDLNEEATLDFSFNHAPIAGKTILSAHHLTFGYEGGVALFENLSFNLGKQDRLGIIGKNGKGKSTLLNLLAGELTPVEGTMGFHPNMKIGHFGQTNIARLHDEFTVVDEIHASNPALTTEKARTISGTMMFGQGLALKKIKVLSGGERSRVLLGKILADSANLLLLDEPTNHLDQESIESLIEGLQQFEGAVVLVTHDERLLNAVVNRLVVFHRGRAEYLEGDYDYFLGKYGWEEEGIEENRVIGKMIVPKQPQGEENKKEIRKQKSMEREERARMAKPLEEKIAALEKKIEESSQKLNISNEERLKASQSRDVETFIRLAKEIKLLERELEIDFQELEVATKEYLELGA